MARFDHGEFADAPTMIMSPTNSGQLSANSPLAPYADTAETRESDGTSHRNSKGATSWTPAESTRSVTTNPSRKRSRDEEDFSSDPDGSYFPSQQLNTPDPIAEEPIYGEGMALLNPGTGGSIPAESQTGTWYEEKVQTQTEPQPSPPPESRPRLPSPRKSVRLGPSAAPLPPRLDGIAAAIPPESPPKSSSSHPTIDDCTYALGIGWTRLNSEDPDISAAARGWARYLENHYPRDIHGAEILLQSNGLNAYLVGSREGFFLFSEDLLEGRLVGRNWESCLTNLRSHPLAFDGEEVLRAERTPGPDTAFGDEMDNGRAMDTCMTNGKDAGINGRMEID